MNNNTMNNDTTSYTNVQSQTTPPPPAVNQFLSTFRTLITGFYDHTNTVLTGSVILLLHGLKMSRIPVDLDIVIFKPTEKQLQYIEAVKFFDCIKDRPDGYVQTNAYKFKKEELFLDVIITQQDMPAMLQYTHEQSVYNIQMVDNIIAAKKSYSLDKGGFRKYIREKDAKDFLDLKNCNFNY